MSWLGFVVALAMLTLGLVIAARARGHGRDGEALLGLGFVRAAAGFSTTRSGRTISARPTRDALHLVTPLMAAPLPYEVLARALGRGPLLAALFQLGARASQDRLEATLSSGLRAGALERALSDLVALADALESLPRAEAMARWFLELATGEDRAEALTRLIDAFPDAPETLAACRAERDQPRDARAAALARAHLESDGQPAAAGRPGPPDV